MCLTKAYWIELGQQVLKFVELVTATAEFLTKPPPSLIYIYSSLRTINVSASSTPPSINISIHRHKVKVSTNGARTHFQTRLFRIDILVQFLQFISYVPCYTLIDIMEIKGPYWRPEFRLGINMGTKNFWTWAVRSFQCRNACNLKVFPIAAPNKAMYISTPRRVYFKVLPSIMCPTLIDFREDYLLTFRELHLTSTLHSLRQTTDNLQEDDKP